MADGYILTTETYEMARRLLPRGIIVTDSQQYGGALRLAIRGKELIEGMGYQFVFTDGHLLTCIELVENPSPEDGQSVGDLQARRVPV